MKTGWKTSENIMVWAVAALGGGYGLQDDEPLVRFGALLAIGLVALGYQISRGLAKSGGAS